MKLTIFCCDAHNHATGKVDGKTVFSNDYSYENVLRLADALGWEVNITTLTAQEYEAKFS